MSEPFPRTVEEIDPAEIYTKGRLHHIRIGRNRALCEALNNDPLAPRFRVCDKNKRTHGAAKFYLGKDLIDYINGAPVDWSELEQRAIQSIESGVAKERADLKKERQELAEARQKLQAQMDGERRSWRDERLLAVRDDILSALSGERLRRTTINPLIRRSGVYFLKLRGEIVYVGQSVNMFVRVNSHLDKEFDEVLFFACEPHELNRWEGFFIRFLRPRLNGGCSSEEANASAPISDLWQRVAGWKNDLDPADIPWLAEQSPAPKGKRRGRPAGRSA
jgi:hypothetical protein